MGNSSSKASIKSGETYISKPKALGAGIAYAATTDKIDEGRNRRHATSPPPSGGFLGLPQAHRRSRSAQAVRNRESAPPPYSFAVASGGSLPFDASQKDDTGGYLDFSGQLVSSPVEDAPTHPLTGRPLQRRNTVENALDTLKKYDTVMIIDDSGSMEGPRWHEAREALASLAEIAARYDADGVDVCFLNSHRVGTNMRQSADLVRRLFDSVRPAGITPIGERLEQLMWHYMEGLEKAKAQFDAGDERPLARIKPINYIVITDGAPTDDPETVIVSVARRLDAGKFPLNQIGIQFVQIGNSPDATAFLRELDDGLSDSFKIRDIVDTTPYNGAQLSAETIIKILLGGINRRVDKRGGQSVL